MGHRAHPTVAWRSSLAVLVVAWACATPEPFDASDVEVAPAELVRAALGPTGEPPPAELAFEFPDEGAIFVKAPVALVAGRLLAPGTGSRIDAALVIDTSGSTAEVSGADVDRDGVVGTSAARGDRDPDDSILAAEVAAARRLVQGVDLATTRVGIVRFSGYVYQSHDRYADPRSYRTRSRQSSETRAPLGRDVAALDAALDRIGAIPGVRGSETLIQLSTKIDRRG